MMLPEMTPAVERAVLAAHQWTHRAGSSRMESVHLLLGFLEEEDGRVAVLLTRAGIDPTTVRDVLSVGFTRPGEPEHPPEFAPVLQTVFQRARILAGEISPDRFIASESLLFSLLDVDRELRTTLESLGLKFDRLDALVEEFRGPPVVVEDVLHLDEDLEQVEVLRILDACADRVREALRVLEDYCRFALDDAFLSEQLKRLRHDLTGVLTELLPPSSLAARDTLNDVGTGISTKQERERSSLRAVASANWKRLQEGLRSLEEFSKLHHPDAARKIEGYRYRSYTLEKAMFLGVSSGEQLARTRLYLLVSGAGCTAALDWTIEEAAEGGVDIVQLREKQLDDRTLLQRARQVRKWTRKAGVLFILNDRPDLARLAEADGVHLGQEDLPVREARRILGSESLIGVSTHNLEQLNQAILEGANYVGAGPVFPSETKAFTEFPGLDFLQSAVGQTSLPVFAIGGIDTGNLSRVLQVGARRIAVGNAICRADDPRSCAHRLRQQIEASLEKQADTEE